MPIRLSVLARKTGLNHTNRNRDLRQAFRAVEAVYKERGGLIEFIDLGSNVGMLLRRAMRLKPPRDPYAVVDHGPKATPRERLQSDPVEQEVITQAAHARSEWEEAKWSYDDGKVCHGYENKRTGEFREKRPF
jgi:hypothetical protein